jgi:hypothetical protein
VHRAQGCRGTCLAPALGSTPASPQLGPPPACPCACPCACAAGPESGSISIAIPGVQGAAAEQHFSFEQPGDHFPLLTLRLPYSALQLWWPVGYGQQPLYNLTASLAPGGGSCCGAKQGAGCNALCSQQSRCEARARARRHVF